MLKPRNFSTFFILVALSALLSACGQHGKDLNGNCDEGFISAFNEMSISAANALEMNDVESLKDARQIVKDFKKEYKGLNCTAQRTQSPNAFWGEESDIDASIEADNRLELIDNALQSLKVK